MSDPNIRVVKTPESNANDAFLYTEIVSGHNYYAWVASDRTTERRGYTVHITPWDNGPQSTPKDLILALEHMADRLREFHEHRLTVRRSKHYAVAWCPKCLQFWIHADKWSAVQETFPEMVHLLGGRVT